MRRTLLRTAALAALLAGGPALAGDVALVVANTDYQTARDLPPEVTGGVDALVAALNAAGYEVYDGRDLTAQQMFEILAAFAEKLDGEGRVVIFFAGHPVNAVRETWLMPVDADRPGPATAAFTGPSLDLLLGFAAQSRDRAVVILETGAEGFETQSFLKNGLGPVNPPNGVLVLQGPAGGLGGFIADTLLAPGVPVTAALQAIEGSVTVAGSVKGDLVFGPAATTPARPPAAERPVRPPVSVTPPPRSPAEEAEAALGLTRSQRARIQEMLAILGFDPRGIDGVFGPNTRAAIARWQKAEGLNETGYLRDQQLERLERQAAKRAQELAAEAERLRRQAEREDRAYWQETGAGGTARGLRLYLQRYPNGLFAAEAARALERIEREQAQAARAEERQAWEAARRADTIAAYERYLAAYPRGFAAEQAAERIAALRDENRDAAQRARQKEREDALGLSYQSRVSIEQRLRNLGFRVGVVDGTFDSATRAAIRAFQRTRALQVTGFMNEPTLARLAAETRS